MPRLSTQEVQAYTERQLMDQSRRIYEEPLPALSALSLIPPDPNAVALGAANFNRRVYKQFGHAQWTGHKATDLPEAGFAVIEDVYSVGMFGIKITHSYQEQRRAAYAGVQLESRRAMAAKRALFQFHNNVAVYGSPTKQIFGYTSIPYVPRVVLSKSLFQFGANPDATLDALYGLEERIEQQSEGVEMPDTLALAYDEYNYLARTRVSMLGNQTILQAFKANAQTIKHVVKQRELNGASASGTNLMAVLSTSKDRLEHVAPDPMTILPVSWDGFNSEQVFVAETGGAISEFPNGHLIVEMDS